MNGATPLSPPPDLMPSARHWSVLHLLLWWLAAPVILLVLRWVLTLGIYEATLEGQSVRIVSGVWSSGFADGAFICGVVIALLVLGWETGTWFAGRKSRASIRAAESVTHRDVLM